MKALNKQALREAAEKATAGKWVVELGDEVYAVDGNDSEQIAMVFSDNGRSDAVFIAAASPVAVLSLLDENLQLQRDKDSLEAVAIAMRDDMRDAREKLEAAEKRIAELERSETQLINERDDAESAMNDAYKAVMGQAPEWSNWFSFADAIDEIELACRLWRNQTEDVIQFRQRIAELEARTVNLPKRSVGEVMHMSGFSRDYAEGWCSGNDNAIHEIRAAGISVKEK
ncbi:ead/Ea22-like family protein [Citrobacter sp. Cpa228]|uniref:ead/Ea22-like family protein n=1 Tax=Citrobacter sp. Cpa228 TaxID=2985119 RepID=UPI0025748FE9|nr:ead/Ea22-like family protein [Citrobacter sp. Cpa228]MDM2925613.1 ead/Ea22-like family protein [Citrobacter sp. Cpa228]